MDIESNSVNDELELVFCHDAINNNWDEFLSNVNGVHFEQTSLWAKVSLQNNFCISYILVLLFQSSHIVGGSLVLIRQYGKMGRIGIVSQGPCFIHENEKYSHKIIEGFKSLVASEKLMYLTVDVLNTLQTFSVKLLHNGFLRHPKHIPPHPIIESTLLLNLQASEDDIFAQFEPSRRRNIRAGLKFNFHTKVGTRDDIPVFLT
jgi:lipid II:glycine glycyltransferase (peptidoglycan interpeptide bridge formation enzyme)